MSKAAKKDGVSRQAIHNRRQRVLRRTFGLCERCGRKHGPNAYCGRDPERRRAQVREAMKRYREKLKLGKQTAEI